MSSPYSTCLSAIDAAHSLDPTTHTLPDGTTIPYELHYAQKCTSYLQKLTSTPSEPLSLATRAQHFRRWEIPRSSYPLTRIGYHSWRSALKTRQASLVHTICLDSGYPQEIADRVASLIRKEDMKSDAEAQMVEDVACLVFLDDQFEAFEKGHDEEKIIGILRKTWGKMSEEGRRLALGIGMSERARGLVGRALGEKE
ncbi:glutamyl-tRNA synthetase [Sporormia fimetaria CBS 119925]|uniref:Glutamyl-tRNA synthetase n=1 Tax=Sporormia fimetaria CBS 119925 TaxID=1340428 RepID=A0A6A6VK26_9PLEO|nr:glutamyl-tRNA synthetase [Sporormia fimetaria CBS 119925]